MSRRPRILVINQYYWPGVEATAHLLSELCAELARDYDVTVITGRLRDRDNPRRETHQGVSIVRVRSTTFFRKNIWLRAMNYVSFLLGALARGIRERRPDLVLSMTDPPVVGDVGLVVARRFRAPLVVVSQDVFPEIAVQLKRLESPTVIHVLRLAIRFYLRRATCIVAIGETMRKRLIEKGGHSDRIHVIPNWVDTQKLGPSARDNAWSREEGLANRFVVMHSGNVGHAQNLDALVRAATFVRDLGDLSIAVIGQGPRRELLEQLSELLEVDGTVRFWDYQPREVLTYSLASAHVHVVGLARGLAGYVVPSRVYGILAAGRPIIAAVDEQSETAALVREAGCGVVIPPGRPELLARAIRAAHDGELDLESMGARGREYVVRTADRTAAVTRYREVLDGVLRAA